MDGRHSLCSAKGTEDHFSARTRHLPEGQRHPVSERPPLEGVVPWCEGSYAPKKMASVVEMQVLIEMEIAQLAKLHC